MCGGTWTMADGTKYQKGLSPRVRGNHRLDKSRSSTVYPRVCGGTLSVMPATRFITGLSPRVRGNREVALVGPHCRGSIPACAGEPRCSSPNTRRTWVYPRVCGGTVRSTASNVPTGGLSPRVRGNPGCQRGIPSALGSIPACAGEPAQSLTHLSYATVYPRVCGGTVKWDLSAPTVAGLSPRVRGNHLESDRVWVN